MNRWCFAGLVLISVCGLSAEAQSRVIDDAALHTRWILVPNTQYPAGPGHWIRAGAVPDPAEKVPASESRNAKNPPALQLPSRPKVIIHTGDAVKVLHETQSSRLELEAKALENATEGGKLRVRLSTGNIVQAVATAPERVDLVHQFFARREP